MTTVELPRVFDLPAIPGVVAQWPTDATPVEVVLHNNQWVEPAGLTSLACLIERTKRDGGSVAVRHDGCATVGYWERMGFFREMALDGPPPSGISRSPEGRFAEIRRIADINDVDEITEELASVVQLERKERRTISHILSEAMNNVCQHSAAHGFSSAQYWANTGLMKFCIADYGRGLLDALSALYGPKSDCEAIELALRVGVTSRPPSFGQPQMRNRGVGLSCAHRLVTSNAGAFDIWSGNGWFNGIASQLTNVRWTGTLIAVTMQRASLTADFQRIMSELSDELRLVERQRGPSGRAKGTM